MSQQEQLQQPRISVSSSFDGGNIEFVEQIQTDGNGDINIIVRIKPDVHTELEKISHMQYFCFRVILSGVDKPTNVKYIIENASKVSYPEAWVGSTVCYTSGSYSDVDSWKRNLSTTYTDGKLCWDHLHTTNGSIYFSYFPPYTYERHLSLISKCQEKENSQKICKVESLGQSLDGKEIECISLGFGKLVCWIIHRQHPGETMAEHYAEGLLYRLLGDLQMPYNTDNSPDKSPENDTVVQTLLQKYTFYIVPCMCPDGGVRGHLRTNATGANLNREWTTVHDDYEAPTLERSPEVYCVLKKMEQTGVDMFLDVHGDEELPYNFLSGAEHVPTWNKRLEKLHGAFVASYSRNNSDMQQHIGYPPPPSPEKVLKYLNVATNQIATKFNCLAVTLEMPFKDCVSNKDPNYGWTPKRSRKLGASVLESLLYIQPYLRDTPEENDNEEYWNTALPQEDSYVTPTDDYVLDDGFDSHQFHKLKKYYSDVRDITN